MSDISSQLRDLSPNQRERLLAKLREIRPAEEQRTGADFSRRMAESGMLSFAQQRLWFLHQMYPETTAYHVPLTFRINLPVNVRILEKALIEIARRHEILRTTFRLRDGQPIQSVTPSATIRLRTTDLRDLPEGERDSVAINLIREDFGQGFDLSNGPCWRAFLLQLNNDKFILQVVFHHIIFDGWSIPIFLKELKANYEAFASQGPSPFPELPAQYLDFTLGQREWLQKPVLQSQLAYWKNHLADAPPLLLLPTDRPRPTALSFRGNNQIFKLPEPLTAKLKQLAQAEDATLFMTVLAAFKTLLYRYSRQADILVGTPIANRNQYELEGLIGLFLNTLALRSKVSDQMSFRQLLRTVRETCLDAYTHQDLPFEQLVEELCPRRDPQHTPIFQVAFTLQTPPPWLRVSSQWSVQGMAMRNDSSQFDLTLNMEDRGQGLVGALEYNTDIFEDATIARMLRNFQTLFEGIASDPDTHVGSLPLVSVEERRQLVQEWNKTEAGYPTDACLPQLFTSAARQSPRAVAIAEGGGEITFDQLNRRANKLAHRLRREGIGLESVVAVYMNRSIEMVIALLGIMKSSAAYLPLDPSNSVSRLSFMLEDSRAAVLVTDGRSDLNFVPGDVVTLRLDHEAINLEDEDDTDPAIVPDPENLAYVLYTSGSTGKPKGVLVRHGSLVNHSLAVSKHYELNSSDRALQFAAIGFDVAAEELFPSLLAGAHVVLRPDQLLSPGDLMQFIEREGVTVANLPSSYWHELVDELSRTGMRLPPSLRLIVVGSEKVAPEKLTEWNNLLIDKPQLINAYGATETTVTTSTYFCPNQPIENAQRSVPVGRPIENAKIYLLDPNLQLAPLGVPGELFVGGELLARGYLNQPSLTAEKFIPDRFSDTPGARLYRTGDLARYQPDGNIELIGRTDHQIKFRGFRIELGEIESVLAQHPDVRDAVVLLVNQRNGQNEIQTLAQQLAHLDRETSLNLLNEVALTF
ncbi:MAG TPA: amino acid adenylation domain-containing protein [Pyrinomonadaceae bacterium]|nr:amino acid adenylation domain-containing protein [Pyrinomonadaceae bacterium]